MGAFCTPKLSLAWGILHTVIDDWIDYYNRERYVWNLTYLSPDEYYQFYLTGVYPLNVPIPKRSQVAWGSAPNPEV